MYQRVASSKYEDFQTTQDPLIRMTTPRGASPAEVSVSSYGDRQSMMMNRYRSGSDPSIGRRRVRDVGSGHPFGVSYDDIEDVKDDYYYKPGGRGGSRAASPRFFSHSSNSTSDDDEDEVHRRTKDRKARRKKKKQHRDVRKSKSRERRKNNHKSREPKGGYYEKRADLPKKNGINWQEAYDQKKDSGGRRASPRITFPKVDQHHRRSRESPMSYRRRASSLSPESLMRHVSPPRAPPIRDHHHHHHHQPRRQLNGSSSSGSGFVVSRNSTGSTIAFPRIDSQSALLLSPMTTPSPLSDDRVPLMVEAYDRLIAESVGTYFRLSRNIGPILQQQAGIVVDLFHVQREFLLSSCKNRTPSAGTGPTQADRIRQVRQCAAEYGEHGSLTPHLKFISDTIGGMGWIVAGNKPSMFIRESYEGGKKYVREIKRNSVRGSSQTLHADWIRAWQDVILELEAFVREWHPYGLIWGKQE